jgi:hypothetical protein
MNATLPTPKTTVAILLGASEFPKAESLFAPSPSFAASSRDFRAYLTEQEEFGLPRENLLDLFDSSLSSSQMDEQVGLFLKARSQGENAFRDVVVYYVGHGGFAGLDSDYFLALRDTRPDNDLLTSYSVRSLAKTLKLYANKARRFLIFDSCFSAAAYREFQSGPLEVAQLKILGELPPEKGTALLCASGPRNPAKAPSGAKYTMFSGAMLDVLRKGIPGSDAAVSFLTLAELISDRVRVLYEDLGVRPQIHFPEQDQGSIGKLPFFPNPMARVQSAEQKILKIERRVADLEIEQKQIRNKFGVASDSFDQSISSNVEAIVQLTERLDAIGSYRTQQEDHPKKADSIYIAGMEVDKNEWNEIPADVKSGIMRWRGQRVNSLVYALLCCAVVIGSWLPLPMFSNNGLLWSGPFVLDLLFGSVSLILSVLSFRGISHLRLLSTPDFKEREGYWQNFSVVLKYRNYRAGEVLPSFHVSRAWLSLGALALAINGVAVLSMLAPQLIQR